jgi:hypothetical protein
MKKITKKFKHSASIKLEIGRDGETGELRFSAGPRPYIWIGSKEKGCYGCVADKDVEKLIRMVLSL